MKQYLVPFILILFLAFGLVSGTSHAAETQDTNSANNTASTEIPTSVQTRFSTRYDLNTTRYNHRTTRYESNKPGYHITKTRCDINFYTTCYFREGP
ncbi:hypothetical protein MT342_10975 [Staphylococcus sp. NRL 21/187]|nr:MULTISPECIES: hypothetical protein [unclassified Staphylococcus]MCJ1657086.1 hypothetical protein [Staphylococcus sp. NRL 21/187]MCJ1668946.1 hypothetical protein [Staphylococcus sp. NRL 19/737]